MGIFNKSDKIKTTGTKHSLFRSLGLEVILIAVGLILIIVLILNYFSIIPLSKTFPSLFGWLPHREAFDDLAVDPEVPFPEDFFLCPVAGESCKTAWAVLDEDKTRVVGIGYFYLLRNTNLQAMMEGAYTIRRNSEGNTEILLVDRDGNIEVLYVFSETTDEIEEVLEPRHVGRGDVIYTINNPNVVIETPGASRKYALIVYIRQVGEGAPINASVDRETGRVNLR